MTDGKMLRMPDEILRTALKKEAQARDFYKKLAATCSDDFVRVLLLRLQDEEHKHVHLIEDMLARLDSGKRLV